MNILLIALCVCVIFLSVPIVRSIIALALSLIIALLFIAVVLCGAIALAVYLTVVSGNYII